MKFHGVFQNCKLVSDNSFFFFLMEVGSSWDKSPGLEVGRTGGGGFKFPLPPSSAGLASSAAMNCWLWGNEDPEQHWSLKANLTGGAAGWGGGSNEKTSINKILTGAV